MFSSLEDLVDMASLHMVMGRQLGHAVKLHANVRLKKEN